jgi:hypothetical protein
LRLGPHKLALTALPFVTECEGTAMSFHTLHVNATLKHAYLFLKVRKNTVYIVVEFHQKSFSTFNRLWTQYIPGL